METALPIGNLLTDIDVLLNRRAHGMSAQETETTLVSLRRRGWVTARQAGCPIAPTPTVVRRSLGPRPPRSPVFLRLTRRGGAAWETFAAPDWSVYVSVRILPGRETGEHDVRLTSKNRAALETMFAAVVRGGFPPDDAAVETREVDWWSATYWKQLRGGTRTGSSRTTPCRETWVATTPPTARC